ncbi:muconolactone Delta-isomerase family protein [Streptomyces sp. NPDC097727]|uniref:muconolactone Delta-isomerase family protein n=1 Tax=Streptomyces sp. NPDC097727 TaxID=3366092 RepID=UPI00382B74E1
MEEFLVELATTVFEGSGPAEVDRRRAEESVGAGGLAAAGHLVRPWCPVGELRGIGPWGAADEGELYEDEGELYEKELGTLPLWPWMASVMAVLESHPNDPGRTAVTT